MRAQLYSAQVSLQKSAQIKDDLLMRKSLTILIALGFVLAWQARQLMAAGTLVFFHGGDTNFQRGLYNFDTSTGISTFRVAVAGTERFDSMTIRPSDGVVFAAVPDFVNFGDDLYTIDINTGSSTKIAPLSFSSDYVENISFDPSTGTLYGLQRNGPGLFIIDPANGQCTQVASKAFFVNSGFDFAPDHRLFATNSDNGQLYRIDPITGAQTPVGIGTGTSLSLEDAAFLPGGEMFVADFRGGEIYRFDTSTGQRTLVGITAEGLTALIAVPEPPTMVLASVGLAAFFAACKWRATTPIRRI